MSSINFAAAQERVLARQRERQSHLRALEVERQAARGSSTLTRLPYPANRVSQIGFSFWDVIKGREGTRPEYRVGQVDAELLDEELLDLFKGQVGEALKYFNPHLRDDWSHEILLALRAVLFKLSIWDHNASYGAALQNLQYTDGRSSSAIKPPPTTSQKILYGLLTVGGRYAWDKWEDWLIGQEGGYDEPSPNVALLSRLTSFATATHSIAAFASFLVFLVNGRYRTLIDRILRLRLSSPSSQVSREVSFEYLNRQLVWHAFTEFLLFLLPLVGIGRWRRWLSRAWKRTKSALKSSEDGDVAEKQGELAFLPERTCAICYQTQNPATTSESDLLGVNSGGVIGSAQTDIANPYETIPCNCIYCYMCIAQKIEAEDGQGWTCLRCGEIVKECRPWNGDVIEESPKSDSAKTVGFARVETSDATDEETKAEGGENGLPSYEDAAAETLTGSSQWSNIEKEDDKSDEEKAAPGAR